MKSLLRAACAMLLASLVGGVGLVEMPGAEAVVPTGGCWTYVPDPLDPAIDAAPGTDVSTALEPWRTDATQILLGTSGATVVGGTRDLVVAISAGPVVSDVAAIGTAYVVVSVDGVPLDEPLSTPFVAAADTPVSDIVVRGSVPVDAAGAHSVSVDSVYFDVPAAGQRVACNGQTEGTPGGPNPATDPLPTGITGEYDAVATSSATVAKVVGQRVTDAARAGDTVRVLATGLASSVPATYQLCVGDACALTGTAWVQQDGTATIDVPVADGTDPGDATITVDDGTTSVATGVTVLDTPTIAASEKVGDTTTTVTVTGSDWDPGRNVTVAGYAGDDTTAARTTDPAVRAEVDADGSFTATYEVADEDTETIGVTQGDSLAAGYAFSGTVGTATDDGTDTGTDDGGTDTGTDTGSSTDTGTDDGAVDDPGDIPKPGDLPIDEEGDDTPPVTPEQTEDLTVSEAHLDGRADLAEMFGGSPRRDLVFLVENSGDTTVENPIVRVAVGRSEDIEPEVVDVTVGTLEPGDQTVVTVPLELPMAAFGTYRVVGQVGDADAGAFELDWTTYPWGLFALNALAAALLAWGVRHRLAARRPAPYRPAGALAGGLTSGDDAVVDLAAAESWWAYRARGGVPATLPGEAPTVVVEELAGDAVVDLEAAEKWWARRGSGKGSQAS